jgi:hypothetical protein
MRKTMFLICCLFLLSIAAPANAQKVAVGYDRSADFSKFKSYTWTKGVPARNPAIDQQIISIIEQQLAAKGLQRVNENGDLNLSYHAAVITDFDQATVAAAGPNPGSVAWVPQMGSMTQVWQVVRGSLIIVMKDPKNDQDIWRGAATDTLSNDPSKDISKDVNKASKKIRKVVEKMFKGFPPGTKS